MQLIRGISADEENWKSRLLFNQPDSELIARKAGHHEIRYKDINIIHVMPKAFCSFEARSSLQDRMAAMKEMHIKEFP